MKSKKKVEYSFTTSKIHPSEKLPPKSVKKNLIKFSKKFHKEIEAISFNLPKGSLMMVDENIKQKEIKLKGRTERLKKQ